MGPQPQSKDVGVMSKSPIRFGIDKKNMFCKDRSERCQRQGEKDAWRGQPSSVCSDGACPRFFSERSDSNLNDMKLLADDRCLRGHPSAFGSYLGISNRSSCRAREIAGTAYGTQEFLAPAQEILA